MGFWIVVIVTILVAVQFIGCELVKSYKTKRWQKILLSSYEIIGLVILVFVWTLLYNEGKPPPASDSPVDESALVGIDR